MNNFVYDLRDRLSRFLASELGLGMIECASSKGAAVDRKFGVRQLKALCLSLWVGAFLLWIPRAEAQFSPISLSGGALVKMVADYQRPCIYAIQAPAAGATNGNLLFINTTDGSLIKTLPISSDPTDLAINVAENMLYVIGYSNNAVYRVDLRTQTLLSSFNFGTKLSTISGLNSGRFLVEGQGNCYFCSTATGIPATTNWISFDGDGAADASGSYYFTGSVGSSPPEILRWQIQGDYLAAGAPVYVQQLQCVNAYGSYNLILSHDNSRLFYNGNVYDTNLNQLAWLGSDVFACSSNGMVIFSSTQVFDGTSWLPMYDLPATSTVMAVDGSDQSLWYYNSVSNTVESLPLSLVQKPVIIQQPTNQTIIGGYPAVIGVLASGRSPLVYTWYHNGTNIAFATTNQISIANFQAADAGSYFVVITNDYGSISSSNAVITVRLLPPSFTSQPSNLVATIGANASLSASAIGSLPISYQWRLNGVNVNGATNPVLNLTDLQLADQGNYDVVVTNEYGSTNSSAGFLNVVSLATALNAANFNWITGGDLPWQIEFSVTHDGVAALQSGSIVSGQQSTLQTTVTGPGTLTYWWNINSMFGAGYNYLIFSVNGLEQSRITYVTGWLPVTNYLGAGDQTLLWTFTQPTDTAVSPAGYVDQVSFAPGATPPFITQNPANQVVLLGSNVTVNAAVLGTPPLSYQWQLNGTNVDGATNVSLVLSNAQFANEGNYTLVISNPFGVTNTTAAFVNVVDFTESLNATNLVWSTSGNRAWFPETTVTHDGVAALQSGAISGSQQSTVSTTVSGPGTLSFWWKVSSETNNDYVNLTVDGAEQARNSGLLNQWQQKTFYLTSGTHLLAWNYSKNATANYGSDAAWLDQVSYVPGGTAAVAASGPVDQAALLSSNATFTVSALGTPPISYQWLFNGSVIPAATNSSLTITNVQIVNSGKYSVVLANDYGSTASSNAFLYLLNLYAWGAGKTYTWASPEYGQSSVPANLIGIKAIAGGGYHSMALLNSGRVVSWGNNYYGQTNQPATLTNGSAIAAGFYHSMALRSNGTVAVWGSSSYGQTTVPASATNITSIAAGWYHSLALRSNGTVVAWGAGTSLGSAPYYSGQSIVPTNLAGVAAIAAGGYHSLALRTNGTVVAWGWNAFGQTNVPAGLSNVVAIAAGGSNSVALKSDGTLVAWGANGNGQTNIPNGLTNVAAISCGAAHNLALLNDGSLMSWGLNASSQTNVPANVTNVAAIAAGGYHNLALVNAGPVTFLNPPYSQSIFKGGSAIFNPAVLGLAPVTFQWLQNGTNVSNGTQATLVLTGAQLSDAGNYQLMASNSFGAVTSAPAVLTVNDTAPFFTVQPANLAVLQYSNFTLSASVGGLPPFAYQWCLNGVPIATATNPVLMVTNAQLANEGFYSVLASNACGAAVSSNAFVDVIDVPQALGLTNVSWFNPGTPFWSAESTNTHDGFAAASSGLLPYDYLNMLRTSVSGPGKLSFWCSGNLGVTLTFAIDDSQQTSQHFYSSSGWCQFTYYLPGKSHMLTWTAWNQSSSFYSNTAFLDDVVFTPGTTPVSITTQPASQTVAAGNSVTFSVGAAGTPPLSYQWYFNGNVVPGAMSSSLTLSDVQTAAAGTYTVVVSGLANTVTSSSAGLTVTSCAPVISTQPVGGAVGLGATFTFTAGATGTEPLFYQWLFNNSPIPGATGSSLTVTNVQYSAGGSYTLMASNAAGSTPSSNALLAPYSLGDLGAALDNSSLIWITTNVPWFPQTNTTYDGVSAAQSGVISGSQSSTLQTTVTGPAMVVYWWKVNCDSFWDALAFSANGVIQSSIAGTVDWQLNTNYLGSGSQTLQWNLYPVNNAFAGGTAWVDQVRIIPIAGVAPAITAQTGDLTTSAGNNAAFSVTATGTPPLCYQWQLNGVDVPGGTNSSLTLNKVQPANAGNYSMVVTNDFGSAAGTNAALTVNNSAPVITSQPASQTNTFYSSATFNVLVKGNSPFSYQWFFNNTAISGAVSNSLVVSNLQLSSAGNYSVAVTNACGQAASLNAKLTVVSSRVIDYLPYTYASLVQPTSLGNITAIAAGASHTLALRQDGTVIAWGNNYYRQTNVPSGLSNVVAIAAGNNHNLALRADGTLLAWGDYGYGQGGVPDGLSNVVAISSGPAYNLALKSDGSVAGWGDDNYGQTDIPAGLTNVQSIFAGYYNGYAIKSDGSLVQWGTGPVWQHNGTNTQLIFTGSNIVNLAAAAFTGWSLQNDGVARAYGFFDGVAPYTNTYPNMSAWSPATRGQNTYSNTVALAASGTGSPLNDYLLLLSSGGFITEVNVSGGAGDNSSLPYISSNPGNVIAIAANSKHAVALIGDGSPHINWPPLSRIVFSGDTVAFNLNASGASPLNYQWRFNGTNLSDATNSMLVLTNVPLTAAGNYLCVVTNNAGSATSQSASLIVLRSTPRFGGTPASAAAGFGWELDQLSGHGNIIILASTNLADWVPIFTNPAVTGSFQFLDTGATNQPNRFYRAVEQ